MHDHGFWQGFVLGFGLAAVIWLLPMLMARANKRNRSD